MDQNPWKTPFGRLLIGSSIVAAAVGFSLAAGAVAYFRSMSEPKDVVAVEDQNSAELEVANAFEAAAMLPAESSDKSPSLNDAINSLPFEDSEEVAAPPDAELVALGRDDVANEAEQYTAVEAREEPSQ